MSTPNRLHALVLFALLLPGPLAAQLGPIGLTTEGAQWLDNDYPAPSGNGGERLGEELATGDFNGDGVDDLATCIPYDHDWRAARTGSVLVRYGSRGGSLGSGAGPTLLHEAGSDGDRFGAALAAGDFDGDSFDDLAVGISLLGASERGAVYVYYGSSNGLRADIYEYLDEGLAGGSPCDWAYFGTALAAGNFDADPYDDLAIGASGSCEGDSSQRQGGAVYVAHGKSDGLAPFYGYRISQDSPGLYDQVETGDAFGGALATGDFNADGYDDLAIGVHGENNGSGAIQNVMGSPWGLIFVNSVFWLPGALDEVPEANDSLGYALAAGDFDGDGFDDLAIGTPFEDLGPGNVWVNSGQITVAYGAADPDWFDLSRTDHLAQGTIYGDEAHENGNDFFGFDFAAADFDGDGRDDLAISHYGDDWPGEDVGAVTILMGAVPTIGSSPRFHLLGIGWEGVPGDHSERRQWAGFALAAGDFDGSGRADLAFGVTGHDNGAQADAGAVVVLYSEARVFADGFETGAGDRWSATY